MSWQTENQVGRAPQTLERRGAGLVAPAPTQEPGAAPTPTPTRTFGGAVAPAAGGVYAPEMATRTAAPATSTGEIIPKNAENPDGGAIGGNIEAAQAAPEAPAPGIIRSSVGGSMVRFQNPNGVEEIRNTGRPSWQIMQQAGQSELYPQAVQNWKSGLLRESSDAEKSRLAAATQLEIANTPAREAPGAAEERRQKSYVFEEAKKKAEEENRILKQKTEVGEYKNQLVNTPYATFKPGTGHVWEPQTEDLSMDAKAGENVARDKGWQAGLDHLHERQIVRKYLAAKGSYAPGTNMHSVIGDLAASPSAWQGLVKLAKESGVTSAPVQKPGIINTIFPDRPAQWGPVRTEGGVIRGADVVGP